MAHWLEEMTEKERCKLVNQPHRVRTTLPSMTRLTFLTEAAKRNRILRQKETKQEQAMRFGVNITPFKKENKMPKKLYGAAAAAHAKKAGRKGTKTAKKSARKSTGGMIQHKAYSYRNSKGKMVHVAAHSERRAK